ncbi:MAG: tetratricopeptide repeat protein [Vicinamibacterales bacterium]
MSLSLVLALSLLLVHAALPASAQPIPATVKAVAPPSDAEMTILREGVALLNQGKFDEAIATYRKVLAANPDSPGAMYEIALALHEQRDLKGAIAQARLCAQYDFAERDKCLVLLGTAYEEMGEIDQALAIYDAAIAALPTSATLHYNKAVTELQGKKDPERAMRTLKTTARLDPRHAATQSLLGRVFGADDLRTPAVFAFSRFLILEPASPRTGEIFQLWYGLLQTNVTKDADGKLVIAVNRNKKRTEGDLLPLDTYIALSQIDAAGLPAGTPPGARLVQLFTTYLTAVAAHDPGKDANTFLWTYYVPYFRELHARKLVEPFVYHVAQSVGMPGAREWIDANAERTAAFLAWDKDYVWR